MPEFYRGLGYLPDWRRPGVPKYEGALGAGAEPEQFSAITEWPEAFPEFAEDQLTTNSCVGQAVHYLAEYKIARQIGKYLQLSPSWVYWVARMRQGWQTQDQGAMIYDGMQGCMQQGICLNSFMPFRGANGEPDVFSAPDSHAIRQAKRHLFKNARRIDRSQVLDALASGTLCIGGFTVYQHAWFGDQAQNDGKVINPRHQNDFGGGHAVMLAGYDKSRGTVHGPNSWGHEHWGRNSLYRPGWHEIDMDYINNPQMSSDFWTLDYIQEDV